MNEAEALLAEFLAHHDREQDRASALLRKTCLVAGCGAVGSHVAAQLAHAGTNVTSIDYDILERANLPRHYLTNPALIDQPKVVAFARQLRTELPRLQVIRGVKADIDQLTDAQLRELAADVSLIIGATGHTRNDRRLNRLARSLRIPFVAPSMWADGPEQIVGDLHIVNWVNRRGTACFECLRPETDDEAAPVEAQPGGGSEVLRVATLTAEAAISLLLSGPQSAALGRQLDRGANYFLVTRWPPSLRAVRTHRRLGCRACAATRSQGVARRPAPIPQESSAVRDWLIGLGLASATLWHPAAGNLDYWATTAFVAVIGLWWRNRLPSFAQVSDRIRSFVGLDR